MFFLGEILCPNQARWGGVGWRSLVPGRYFSAGQGARASPPLSKRWLLAGPGWTVVPGWSGERAPRRPWFACLHTCSYYSSLCCIVLLCLRLSSLCILSLTYVSTHNYACACLHALILMCAHKSTTKCHQVWPATCSDRHPGQAGRHVAHETHAAALPYADVGISNEHC